ncbi:extracellular solute-binding protein [Microlunatus soli]|uniref:Carbohydrate ABC transporter substrate-binding protein, CUT1 family n=1 Tax=Microlunatus soli TaxID=630515 RepID=A0A1H1VX26_9ACTN|nr:extracellular solute-binding protein [Microlunatus soli]SDS89417.1 carbohydrate ABC transporter substrate-binding protein, CUT1 family [Microlunatus soli]
MDRRRLLGYSAAGLAGAGLATTGLSACAPPAAPRVNTEPAIPPASGKIKLTYWAWLKDLQKVCDIWNAEHPEVEVEAVWIPGGNDGGYQKMFAALASGGGPDIGQIEMRTVPQYLLVNGLVDLSRYGIEQYADRYNEAIWNQCTFDGSTYAVPQDSGPTAFYYQTESLRQVGAEPPKTWDAWAELAVEIRKTGKSNYLECFDVSDPSGFVSYVTQAGASWFTPGDDGWRVDMTDEATMEVARFFDRAIDKDLVNTGFGAFSPGWTAAAAAGQIAAVTNASWGDALIQTVGGGEGKWKVAPMQRWSFGGYGSSQLGGSTAAVLATSKHPKEAMEFAVWMTTSKEGIDAMVEHCGIGWSPNDAYIGASREKPSPWFSGQSYNTEIFKPAAQQQNRRWTWCPITQQLFNILGDGFRQKLTDGKTLVDSVVQAQDRVLETMRQMGLSVTAAAR